VIVATHDHSVIERYGKRTLHLEGGRLAEDLPATGASGGAQL
jgi:ABC-type ATPase involved in cell division